MDHRREVSGPDKRLGPQLPQYAKRWIPVDSEEAFQRIMDGQPWTPSRRRRETGKRLQMMLLNACGVEDHEEDDQDEDAEKKGGAGKDGDAGKDGEDKAGGGETETSPDAPDAATASPLPPHPSIPPLSRTTSTATKPPTPPAPMHPSFAIEAAHGLWELSVERTHHPDFSRGMLRALVAGLSSLVWEVVLYCAGAVWQLARSAAPRRTLVELGVGPYTR